ncbi:hypothetical protein RJT34_28474 [Clitoria ternatea]|uniref:C2H2-type domain-containing protein n=1 Tax=Clitoria ternatea TaxID=43366 RepID=A0AAN9F8W7_CLITE
MLLTKVGESETKEKGDGGDFKCKTCNRGFSSFQALGGHRASHKKPKLMATDLSCNHQLLPNLTMKPKMHPCPICGLEFAIGQALGGHMRKHRTANHHFIKPKHSFPVFKKSKDAHRLNFSLDLNLTPLENDLNLNLSTSVLDCFI